MSFNDSHWHQKTRRYYSFIEASVNSLVTDPGSDDIPDIINEISIVVPKYGLNLQQSNQILDIILDYRNNKLFKNQYKMKLVNLLYHCNELFDFKLFLKIIGSFKLSSYSNESILINKNLQIKLSKFLLNNFVNFQIDRNFLKMLTFLFNLLTVGYIRQNISLIVIYLLSLACKVDPKFDLKLFLNIYKIEFLIEIFEKDKSILPIILVFKDFLNQKNETNSSSQFDSYYYKLLNISENERLPKHSFGSVNYNWVNEILMIKDAYLSFNEDNQEIQREYEKFKENFKSYRQLINYFNTAYGNQYQQQQALKKRKLVIDDSNNNYKALDLLRHFEILNYSTPDSFINNLDDYEIPNQLGSLLYYFNELENLGTNNSTSSTKLTEFSQKVLYGDTVKDDQFSLRLPLYNSLLKLNYNDLNTWFEIVLLQNDTVILKDDYELLFNGLLYLTKYSFKVLPIMKKIVLNEIAIQYESIDENSNRLKIIHYWDFVSFLKFQVWDSFKIEYEKFAHLFEDPGNSIDYLNSVIRLFSNWIIVNEQQDQFDMWYCINKIIEEISMKYTTLYCCSSSSTDTSDLSLRFTFLKLLRFLQTIPMKYVKVSNLVLSPLLTYDLFFSNNPILIDGICDHITYCKKYYGEYLSSSGYNEDAEGMNFELSIDHLQKLRNLHNSYVMDLCNIIWRDRSFEKNEKSKSKGFLLPNMFITKLMKQRYYHYNTDHNNHQTGTEDESHDSNSMKQNYNLFHSPAFASIITNMIRTIEDKSEVEIRLAGPLNEHAFKKLVADGGWLDEYDEKDYDLLRVVILKELYGYGFEGLNNLLFSSLKSLASKRGELLAHER